MQNLLDALNPVLVLLADLLQVLRGHVCSTAGRQSDKAAHRGAACLPGSLEHPQE